MLAAIEAIAFAAPTFLDYLLSTGALLGSAAARACEYLTTPAPPAPSAALLPAEPAAEPAAGAPAPADKRPPTEELTVEALPEAPAGPPRR
jgi:hypothetical protein